MNKTDEEKEILEQAPDFENQMAILKQEQDEQLKKRKWYRLMTGIFSFIFLIFFISYSTIYTYREYEEGYSIVGYACHVHSDQGPGLLR